MPTRTEAIKMFLNNKTIPDLADYYNHNMECQVNVAQDGAERVEGDYKGRKWHGWTDGLTTWKSFRIPYNAATKPDYQDKNMSFDLAAHVEGIGMTGWDWKARVSKWVAFDFDDIVGHSDKHSNKLNNDELEEVRTKAQEIDWVTVRYSTSGKGLHLYVFLDDIETANHNEHSALARSILGKMSALTGFDFISKVDAQGGNMWVWHRKMAGTNGLTLIKQGGVLTDIPPNWRDHLKVVSGYRRKNLPKYIEEAGLVDEFEELVGQRPYIQLDDEHKRLIKYLDDGNHFYWWDSDHKMLVTHTWSLKSAYDELGLRGFFETNSPAANINEQNAFAFPLRRGAWAIRRYSQGIQEHESWSQDGQGWTRCFLNREPDLSTACRAFGGLEEESGGFYFREAEIAIKAAELMGVQLSVAPSLLGRATTLKQHKDGRLIIAVERDANDPPAEMAGWLAKGNKPWTRIYNAQIQSPTEPEVGNYDDIVRHLVTETQEDYGWMIRSDNTWRTEPLAHLKLGLQSMGLNTKDVVAILGASIFKCWKVVNKPFQPEYPGDRQWNRNAAQLRFLPTENREGLIYPTWLKILSHCGKGLDSAIKQNSWAKANGIISGADYLKCWIASLFQEPNEPLPYLFFYGEQNSGKSIFHESLSTLLTKGYKRADAALISQSGFNAELEGAIICVIEETDLRRNKQAYNRIKDWVTSKDLMIHAKGKTPYHIPNTNHFIQCSNDHQSCPVFPGDTRITMCYVDPLSPLELIPKKALIPLLEKEAPDFLAELTNLEIPVSSDRLNIPVIATDDKHLAQELNETPIQTFLKTICKPAPGHMLKFSEFFDKFIEWLAQFDPAAYHDYSKIRVGREIPPQYPKARSRKNGQFYVANLVWATEQIPHDEKLPALVVREGYITEND